ncbi:MAG: hypothetical protein IJ838_03210 [Paludibacteraceae bacterium]|nr:hypothetical protein [Paludibacteraceae bacterium]
MRNIIRIAGIVFAIALVAAAAFWAKRQPKNEVCRALLIRINPSSEAFITEKEVHSLLHQQHIHPVGQKMQEVPLQTIENAVTAHDMVRSAQCSRRGDTCIQLVIEQRHPILRVITATDSYFIDSDRERMPIRAGMKSNVMRVTGHVGERMAKEEVADMVLWLQDNSFWQPRIQSIEIKEGKQVILHQASPEPQIRIGTIENYEQKLNKVRIFIEETTGRSYEFPAYRELDARFDGQVVGRK